MRSPVKRRRVFTLKEKIEAMDSVRELMDGGVSERTACETVDISRGTIQTFFRNEEKIRAAASVGVRKRGSRASRATVGGSGRRSKSHKIEDQLVLHVKDLRREGIVVSMQAIIDEAMVLLPGFLVDASQDACNAWCARFMRRNGLTIRRITHTGRAARSDLEKLRDEFVQIVVETMTNSLLDPTSRVCLPRTLFNMDQTAIYANTGVKVTVEVVGATVVPAETGGNESYRCTAALTVCADGRIVPPHFVFKGAQDGDIAAEVNDYCDESRATFSVQKNAWFDERVMLEYVDKVWKHVVTEPSLMILDSLKVHKCEAVLSAFADLGTMVVFVPGGATGVAQPLDVGVMGPYKHYVRKLYSQRYRGKKPPQTAHERRLDMFNRSMDALEALKTETIVNAFKKAGPFFPEGPIFESV